MTINWLQWIVFLAVQLFTASTAAPIQHVQPPGGMKSHWQHIICASLAVDHCAPVELGFYIFCLLVVSWLCDFCGFQELYCFMCILVVIFCRIECVLFYNNGKNDCRLMKFVIDLLSPWRRHSLLSLISEAKGSFVVFLPYTTFDLGFYNMY